MARIPVKLFISVPGYVDSLLFFRNVLLHLLERLLDLLIFGLLDFGLVFVLPLLAEMGQVELVLGPAMILGHRLSFDSLDVDDARQVLVFVGDRELDLAVVSLIYFAGELQRRFLGGGLARSLRRLSRNDFDYRRRYITSLIAHQPFMFSFLSFLLPNLVYPSLFLRFLELFLVHCCYRAHAAHLSLLFPVDLIDKEVVTG